MAAVTRVFHIPELLELILLNLSTKDLLLSQRTSRAFQTTTQGSVRLRRKLFLEPDWNLEAVPPHGRRPENNCLLLRAFPGCYPTITLVIVSEGGRGDGQMGFSSGGNGESWSWDVCISFPAEAKPTVSPCVEYREASWRKMYLSQPPCTTLYLVRRWQRSLRPAVVRDEGITMGDFFDECSQPEPMGPEDRKWHTSYISSDRDWHFEGSIRCNSAEE